MTTQLQLINIIIIITSCVWFVYLSFIILSSTLRLPVSDFPIQMPHYLPLIFPQHKIQNTVDIMPLVNNISFLVHVRA